MMIPQTFISFALLVASVTASPLEVVERRATSSTVCRGVTYSVNDVTRCEQRACSMWNSGQKYSWGGRPRYPGRFNNGEGFTLRNLRGPFVEFPMKQGATYAGGDPGAARCLIEQTSCTTAGQIVHPPSSSSAFVTCTGSS